MVRNREQAALAAEKTTRNKVGMCQQVTREYFGAGSAGDVDHDGDADAVDGWKREPVTNRHHDRYPPRGVPVSWSGGRRGHGHRAISLGNGKIRTTDAPSGGRTSTQDLDWPERNWGVVYEGWSDTIDGELIPMPPPPPDTRISNFHEQAPFYDLKILSRSIELSGRDELRPVLKEIDGLVKELPHDSGDTRVNRFVRDYNHDRVLRMGMLSAAVEAGRKGQVKKVRDALRRAIKKVPER